LFEILQQNIDPELLVALGTDIRQEIIDYIDKDTLVDLLSRLDTSDAVDIFEDFGDKLTQETISALEPNKKKEDLEEALSYPEDSVGRIMNQKDFVAVPKDWNISDLLKYLKKNKNLPDNIFYIIVVDEYYRPLSVVTINDILRNEGNVSISRIMKNPEDLRIMSANISQAKAANLFLKYDLDFMPVVNYNGVLAGILNSNDIIHVINEEMKEDMMLMASLNSDNTIHTPIRESVKKRLPWLVCATLTASGSMLVINHFSGTIEKFVILSAIMPLISNLSGVSGTQTLAILVRNVSNNDITRRELFKIITKEAVIGLLNGMILSLLTASVLYLWKRDGELSLIFGLTVVVLQTVSCLIGSSIPLILSKLKLDPAVGSGTFITAALDTISASLLLGMATLFLV